MNRSVASSSSSSSVLSLCAASLLLVATAARAADTYEVRPAFKPGLQWSAATESDMKMDVTYTLAGQPPQQGSQRMTQKEGWTLEVLKVDAKTGRPSAVRVKFAADSGGAMEMNGQRQEMPSGLAGQTVTVERDELGILTHDAKTGPAEDQELQQILNGTGVVYAPKPVAVGDSWDADAQEVAKQFQLGKQDTGTVKCTLTGVENAGGRQTAVVTAVVSLRKKEGKADVTLTAKGPIRVDLATGLVIGADITGTTTTTGSDSGPGPDGQVIQVSVEGKGTISIKSTSKLLGGGGGVPVARGDEPAPAPQPPAGDGNGAALAGRYEGDGISLTLTEDGGGVADGELTMGDQKFPVEVKERMTSGVIKGSFSSGDDKFPFTATPGAGGTLKFDSDGNVYSLKKRSNPLAKPKKPNPLAQPRGDAPAPAPAGNAAPPARGHMPAHAGNTLRFERYSLNDDQIIPGEACSFLIPAGWRVTGGIKWRANVYYPAYVELEAGNPNGPEALTILPTIPCIWSQQPMTGFPEGSLYAGSLVKRPTEPADFVKEVVAGRLRPDLKDAEVVKVEDLPEMAKMTMANTAQEAGIQKTSRACRVRFRYERQGVPVEEDVYCTITYAAGQQGYVSMIQDTFFTLRAKAGELDGQARTLAVIQSSVRPNLNWFNRLTQMIQIGHQQGMQRIADIGAWSKAYAQTSAQVSDTITRSYWDRQASQARSSQAFSNTIRGVEQYKDPAGYEFQLPSGYDGAWVSNRGEVIVSNEPGFDPGVTFQEDWKKLERQ